MQKNIVLVGFMGAGKTAVGKELAKRLDLTFVDLDEVIEHKEGRRICDIFTHNGEPHFRRVEKEVTREVSQKLRQVIACGGGVVLDKENVANLKKTGIVIYLKASPAVILERTKAYAHRPLLNVEDPREKIKELLDFRRGFYEQADHTIDTSNATIEEVVARILEIINQEKA
ncbi:shikimate kinase [Candidatus Omnitrophota bacterium]